MITGLSSEKKKTCSRALGVYLHPIKSYYQIRHYRMSVSPSHCSLALFFSGRIVVYSLGREHSSRNRGPTASASQMRYGYTKRLNAVSSARYGCGRKAETEICSVKHQDVLFLIRINIPSTVESRIYNLDGWNIDLS